MVGVVLLKKSRSMGRLSVVNCFHGSRKVRCKLTTVSREVFGPTVITILLTKQIREEKEILKSISEGDEKFSLV